MSPGQPSLWPVHRRHDVRGTLGVIEWPGDVPFPVRRLFYLARVPGGQGRGGHAHRALEQHLVVAAGRVVVRAECGEGRFEWELHERGPGLYVPPMTWLELERFSDDAVVLCFASAPYDEADYIREREEFGALVTVPRGASHGD